MSKVDRNARVPERIRRNFQRLGKALEIEKIGPVSTAPGDPVNPVAWIRVVINGVDYRVPLYQ